MNFEGAYTALITPFTKSGEVDEPALKDLVDFQISEGITGLVPVGTTGESPTLDNDEHIRVIEVVVEQTNGRVPVIAGTGSNSTNEAIQMTKLAAEIGADASLQIAPYYNKPTGEGFYRHFAAVAEAVDIPLIIYNIASRTGKNIENDTMLKIATIPSVHGVKEASGSMSQVTDLVMRKPDSLDILSGDDNLTLPIIALGGSGVISVASNLIPKEMTELVSAAVAGQMEKAREIHYRLLPFFQAIFIETNPIPIKAALAEAGRIDETYRLPMCPMSKSNRKILVDVMKKLKL
ncbi:MAG: 4-hydroxy-tetrahydrodipicolinate synthase [Spirochaetales bacterium]|nr:4-hydroxy-tetrahydrodipicolinate synthase [Spirochaetales bacterium]